MMRIQAKNIRASNSYFMFNEIYLENVKTLIRILRKRQKDDVQLAAGINF